MPAGLEQNDTMFSVRKVPWHGMGAVLDDAPADIDDALRKSGLDWDVVQTPVLFRPPTASGVVEARRPNEDKPAAFVNTRSDDGSVLGIVSDRYRIMQNREAFSWLGNLIGSELHFETAGSLNGGKRTWVLANLPDHVEVGGDAVKMFIFVTNAHDGTRAVKAAVSPIRIVCQNTLTFALQSAPRIYSLNHIADPNGKLLEARAVMGVTMNYAKQFKDLGDRLASEQMTERQLKAVLTKLYPTDDGLGLTDRKKANREEAKAHIMHLFTEGKTVGAAPGSRWSGLNAICEFADYGTATDHDGKLTRAMEDPSGIKRQAFELVTAGASLN